MNRIILRDNKKTNFISQINTLKQRFNLKLWMTIKLIYHLRKGKSIIIQSFKNTAWINNRIEYSYFILCNKFNAVLIEEDNVFFRQIDRRDYNLLLDSYPKGITLFIER